MPQSRPSRRAVSRSGVSTRIGTLGRSRAMRRAVEPELVKQMIAEAEMVLAMFFVILNLVVDIAQAAIDPRIKRGS